MKAVCQREGLLSACQLVAVAAASRDVKPILRNIKAVAEPGRCTLMATDLEIGVRLELRSVVEVESAGAAILPAARLVSILRETTDEKLALEADSDGCMIRGEANEFKMPGEDPQDFPDIPTFTDDKYHEVPAKVLAEMVCRTAFAVAKESARYSMTGVLWEFDEGQARLVATDGRRLAVAQGPAVSQHGPDTKGQTHVVPSKAMTLLERLLQETEEPIRIALRPNEALFQTDRAMLYSRLVEGRFPAYREVFPKKQTVKVPLTVGPFHTAVRQAAIMTDDETKRVKFAFSKGKLTLQTTGAETGSSRVELPIEYDHKAIEINFDPRFLSDMLRVLDPGDALNLELVDGNSPALFRYGTEYSYIVMPLT